MGFFSRLFGRTATEPVQGQVADVYKGLREQILRLRSDKVGAKVAEGKPVAVMMEMGLREAVSTLVAVVDGTTSLYFSNGGGMIGLGPIDSVEKLRSIFCGPPRNTCRC